MNGVDQQTLDVAEINALHSQIESVRAERAIRIGELLVTYKKRFGAHGKWLPWLAENCPGISSQRASEYMRAYKAANPNKFPDDGDSKQRRARKPADQLRSHLGKVSGDLAKAEAAAREADCDDDFMQALQQAIALIGSLLEAQPQE